MSSLGKKSAAMLLSIAMAFSLVSCSGAASGSGTAAGAGGASGAAGTQGKSSEGVSIELEYNGDGERLKAFQALMDDFTAQSGIEVEITAPGNDYEANMKTRMASGDLPDMWDTHGWSVLRYSEYLMPLTDQPWVSRIDDAIMGGIKNKDGDIFVLPLTESASVLLYNKTVVEACGIDMTQIRTWDDFSAACQTIKEKGYVPVYACCDDYGLDAMLLEDIWPTTLTDSDLNPNYASQLQDGSFDWDTNGREALSLIANWWDNGYINVDALTSNVSTLQTDFANGKGAFMLDTTDAVSTCLTYNPDAQIGMIPVPAAAAANKSYVGISEGNYSCFGIWKDTKHPEECKKLLDYLAQKEVAAQFAGTLDGGIVALKDVEVTDSPILTEFRKAQEEFPDDIVYDNFFDRIYLPSGMWNVMHEAVAILFSGGKATDNVDQALEHIKTNYQELSAK